MPLTAPLFAYVFLGQTLSLSPAVLGLKLAAILAAIEAAARKSALADVPAWLNDAYACVDETERAFAAWQIGYALHG